MKLTATRPNLSDVFSVGIKINRLVSDVDLAMFCLPPIFVRFVSFMMIGLGGRLIIVKSVEFVVWVKAWA